MDAKVTINPKQELDVAALCRPIAESSPMPTAAVEGAGHIIRYVNPVFCLLMGKTSEELIGNAFSDVVPTGDECLSLLDRVYQTGQAEIHTGQEESAATPLYWSYALWPVLAAGGRIVGVMFQVTEATPFHRQATAMNQALMVASMRQHEITEEAETLNEQLQAEIIQRKLADEELHARNVELAQSRDYAQSIVESVQQPLLVLDTEMRVRTANQAYYQCFQTTPESTEGQLLYQIEDGRWDIPELRALLSDVLPATKSFNDFELAREFAKAGHKILLVSARQLDSVQMILCTINDVTAHRKTEETLRSAEDRLRHSQKMEAIGRLAGGVAHDFNNLLTAILGYSDLLLDSIGLDNDEQRFKNLQIIKQSGERAAELTKQLLAFSRRQVLQPQVLTLKSMVADLEPMLRRVLGAHIELVIDPGAARGFIRADPGQIGQVIMNLALNARDAMAHGGTLTIATQTIDVQEAFPAENLQPGRYVMLAVKDTGVGMDEETKSRLF